jgi:phage-related protein
MQIVFYKTVKSPVENFINAMDKKDQAKVLACLKSIEDLGLDCPRVQFRQIRGKLWEIKIHAPNAGYRFFYMVLHKNTLVLLHAYKKQSQKTPNKDIAIAEKRLLEVLEDDRHYIN